MLRPKCKTILATENQEKLNQLYSHFVAWVKHLLSNTRLAKENFVCNNEKPRWSGSSVLNIRQQLSVLDIMKPDLLVCFVLLE